MLSLNIEHEPITVTGFVIPVEWDKSGSATVVSIATNSFERYIVLDDPKGRALVNFIDEHVKIRGVISGEDLAGNKFIKLDRYNVLGQQ